MRSARGPARPAPSAPIPARGRGPTRVPRATFAGRLLGRTGVPPEAAERAGLPPWRPDLLLGRAWLPLGRARLPLGTAGLLPDATGLLPAMAGQIPGAAGQRQVPAPRWTTRPRPTTWPRRARGLGSGRPRPCSAHRTTAPGRQFR